MDYIISYIVPLVFILSVAYLYKNIFKKDIENTIPLVFLTIPLILYISVILFNTFKIGLIISIIISIIGMYYMLKNKCFKETISKTIIFYLAIYTFLFIYNLNRKFSMWDEWSHWGEMVKEMLRLDNLYSIKESTLMVHKDYPPLIPIYELFMVKLTGVFKESLLINSIHLFEISLLFPFINKIKSKVKYIIPLIILLIINLVDHHHVMNTLYPDYLVSILVVYLLEFILVEEESAYKQGIVLLGSIFLILTKEISIIFYPLIIGTYFIKNIKKKTNYKEQLLNIFIFILIPLTVYFSYQQYKNNLDVDKQFNTHLLSAITKVKEPYQKVASNNYQVALTKQNITNSYLPLSTFLIGIVLLVISLKGKNKNILNISLFILEFFIYILLLYLLYVYQFGNVEGPSLASFDRYQITFLLIPILYLILKYKDRITYKKALILLTILVLINTPSNIRRLVPALRGYRFEYIDHAKIIKDKVKGTKKVFLLAESTGGEYQYPVKYYANPIITNKEYFELDDNPTKEYKEKLINYLKEYDYFYCIRVEEDTLNTYKDIFKNIEKNTVYKIYYKNNNITLKKAK